MSLGSELPVMWIQCQNKKSRQDLFGASDSMIPDLEGNERSDDFNINDNWAALQQLLPEEQPGRNECDATMTIGQDDYSPGISTGHSFTSTRNLPSFKRREGRQLGRYKLRRNRQHQDDNERPHIPVNPQQAIRDEVASAFDKAFDSGAKKRKKNLDGGDLNDNKDEELSNLRDRMIMAAEVDAFYNEQQRPATAKLTMLDEVVRSLKNSSLYDSILDNRLLDAIRMWLEPLPDRALPSLQLQNDMLDILDKLPATTEHLRQSGIGKIALFHKKSTRVEYTVQRKADHLVAKWARLVSQCNVNYHARPYQVQDYNKDDRLYQPKRFRSDDAAKDIDETRPYVDTPLLMVPDYDVAPRSTIHGDQPRSSSKNHPFSRLNTRMRSLGQNPRQKKKED